MQKIKKQSPSLSTRDNGGGVGGGAGFLQKEEWRKRKSDPLEFHQIWDKNLKVRDLNSSNFKKFKNF